MTGLTDLDKWQSVVIHDDRPHRLRQMAISHQFETVKFMYLNQRNELPLPLQTLFTTNANIHGHNTRHRHDPHINTRRTETLSHSFIHKAPALWYTVPSQIKNVKTVGSFRSKIKRELLNK